jgi:hypothetical protein
MGFTTLTQNGTFFRNTLLARKLLLSDFAGSMLLVIRVALADKARQH